jgi:hypothetical protein
LTYALNQRCLTRNASKVISVPQDARLNSTLNTRLMQALKHSFKQHRKMDASIVVSPQARMLPHPGTCVLDNSRSPPLQLRPLLLPQPRQLVLTLSVQLKRQLMTSAWAWECFTILNAPFLTLPDAALTIAASAALKILLLDTTLGQLFIA